MAPQVSDMAMLPMKDAREVLFELLGAQFLHLQEVSKAADHAPYHTYYLFTVNMAQVYAHSLPVLLTVPITSHYMIQLIPIHRFKKLTDSVAKTMKNLKCREQFELAQVEELMKRVEEDRERTESTSSQRHASSSVSFRPILFVFAISLFLCAVDAPNRRIRSRAAEGNRSDFCD